MMKKYLTTCVMLGAMVALSGCADWERHIQSKLPEPTPAFADKQIMVAPTRSVHEVSYAGRAVDVSPDELAYLQNFLNNVASERGVTVMVAQPDRQAGRLARQRVVALTATIKELGFPVATFQAGEASPDKVSVAVDHLIAIAPKCPDWAFHKYETYSSQNSPNFACADRSNLAAMIANPRDLVTGQVPPAPMGPAALEGDIRYRNGAITELEDPGSATPGG